MKPRQKACYDCLDSKSWSTMVCASLVRCGHVDWSYAQKKSAVDISRAFNMAKPVGGWHERESIRQHRQRPRLVQPTTVVLASPRLLQRFHLEGLPLVPGLPSVYIMKIETKRPPIARRP